VSDEEIKRLRALYEAATPGPWTSDGEHSPDDVSLWGPEGEFITNVDSPGRVRDVPVAFDLSVPNGALLAAARTAVPALLDALATEREEHARTKTERDRLGACDLCGKQQSLPEHHAAIVCETCWSNRAAYLESERDALRAEVERLRTVAEVARHHGCEQCKGLDHSIEIDEALAALASPARTQKRSPEFASMSQARRYAAQKGYCVRCGYPELFPNRDKPCDEHLLRR
jgi:hypothetical protein